MDSIISKCGQRGPNMRCFGDQMAHPYKSNDQGRLGRIESLLSYLFTNPKCKVGLRERGGDGGGGGWGCTSMPSLTLGCPNTLKKQKQKPQTVQ